MPLRRIVLVPVFYFGDRPLTYFFSAEGYDFAENLRARAERTSISGNAGHTMPQLPLAPHQRSKSVAVMEPPKSELPKQRQVPDAFQERILKGDFYMD